jgi:peptide-methionine (R)-S-oxide reductase
MDSSERLVAAGSAVVIAAAIAGIVVNSRATSLRSPAARSFLPVERNPRDGRPIADDKDDEWKSRLTEEQYLVTRRKETEPPFTGKYWNNKANGIYKCVCCESPLFDSSAKFDSGTGWPSFYEPIDEQNVETAVDFSLFTQRTEVLCRKCKAHLGHVFDDAPKPKGGLRYCINSAALNFEATRSQSTDDSQTAPEG